MDLNYSLKFPPLFLNSFPVYIPLLLTAPSIGCWVGVWVLLKILPLTGLFLAQPPCTHTDSSHWPSALGSCSSANPASPCSYYAKDTSIQSHWSTGRCVFLHEFLCLRLGSLFLAPFMPRGFWPSFKRQPKYHCFLDVSRKAHGSLWTQNASLQPAVCSHKMSRIISCSLAFLYSQASLWACLFPRRQQHSGGQMLAVPAVHSQGKCLSRRSGGNLAAGPF